MKNKFGIRLYYNDPNIISDGIEDYYNEFGNYILKVRRVFYSRFGIMLIKHEK